MGPRLLYFAGSTAARVIDALPERYERVELRGPGAGDRAPLGPGVLVVDATVHQLERAGELKQLDPTLAVVPLPPDVPVALAARLLADVFADLALREAYQRAEAELGRLRSESERLNAIGIRLSAESDTEALVELILTTAREITHADAGSLYLVEEGPGGQPRLRFQLVQNESMPAPFTGSKLAIGSQSIAGHVALTGQILNLEDAYAPPAGSPFEIDRTYDERIGYRSRSMLVVPMKNPKDQTVGVLQLINCKPDRSRRFASREEIERETVPFPARFQDLAASLASQAAVALEKSRLYGELRAALEGLEASQQRIIRTERLAALGEMASGVAHDFNNVLAIILGRTELLLAQADDPRLRQQLRVIEQTALDGARTVRRIQEFTRIRRTRPFQPVDLNGVVEGVLDVTRSRWRDAARPQGTDYDVRLETAPVPAVSGDPAELREALTNLVFNALDAMPRGGRLTIQTGAEGERVFCRVTDTGTGMSEDVRRRVFEPFFTTKGVKGSGLGLSVTYGIVTRHGGEIDVESAAGRGSSFLVWLPAALERPERPAPSAPAPAARRLRVLVIDDEPEVRQVLSELITRDGHSVTTCADGQAGIARFQREAFDLVITDLGMPGLSGWEVARLAKLQSARTPVALVTGWSDQFDVEEARDRGVDFVVAKPFRGEDILAVLHQAAARLG